MRVTSPVPHKRARIEIVPLIDIMFFLLASFTMVSLSQSARSPGQGRLQEAARHRNGSG